MEPLTMKKRTAKRARVFLVAKVGVGSGAVDAHIRDISRSGALLESDMPPPAQAKVWLACGDTMLDAHVAWRDGPWFGLQFLTPLAGGFLNDQAGARMKVGAPRAYRSTDAYCSAGPPQSVSNLSGVSAITSAMVASTERETR